jgi:site-specific DNA-methyltransferase (adenine-specific)
MKIGEFELNKVYCIDALEGLKKLPDKSINIVLTDPPYGKQWARGKNAIGLSKHSNEKFENLKWDSATPTKEVFDEMLRVGEIVIIFGGNYFTDKLPVSNGWIVWDKRGDFPRGEQIPFADCELAWTNQNKTIKKYTCIVQGFYNENETDEKRVHPTQKPIKIIRDILKDYDGEVVLDCYMGSGTTAVASKQLGRKFLGFEINSGYVAHANKRLAQEVLF